jgi:hypothetical protein
VRASSVSADCLSGEVRPAGTYAPRQDPHEGSGSPDRPQCSRRRERAARQVSSRRRGAGRVHARRDVGDVRHGALRCVRINGELDVGADALASREAGDDEAASAADTTHGAVGMHERRPARDSIADPNVAGAERSIVRECSRRPPFVGRRAAPEGRSSGPRSMVVAALARPMHRRRSWQALVAW